MARNAEETRKKLLEAAQAEFAERGIAGARVDRIAEAAGCSKAIMYVYFGNKDALFDAVYNSLVEEVLKEAPLDGGDLPAYVGDLYDRFRKSPEIVRLAVWDLLERGGAGARLESIQSANFKKLEVIVKAQKDGVISRRFTPEELIALMTALPLLAVLTDRSPLPEVGKKTILEAMKALISKE